MNIHPSLQILAKFHPYAEIRMDGKQLYWETNRGSTQNSITFFEDAELPEIKRMIFGANDIQLHGNLRFSCTS